MLAKASGASVFLHYEPDLINKGINQGKLYFYCNVLMSSNIYYPKSQVNNNQGGLFKLLEKQLKAIKNNNTPLETWYECRINFTDLLG